MSKARELSQFGGAVTVDGSGNVSLTGTLGVSSGGTGSTTASGALSNLGAQPASTAITTSNIGSQSVNYATSAGSAGNADTLDGNHASAFQSTLVSGTNIKTVGGNSLLGSGDISVGGGATMAFFTSSGSFTVPAGITTIYVSAVGGGGGGGGTGTGLGYQGGGGGGGGGCVDYPLSVTSGQVISITIGSGGAGSDTGNGSAGGSTSIGSLLTLTGGGGGVYNNATSSNATFGDGGGGVGAYGFGKVYKANAWAIQLAGPGCGGSMSGWSGTGAGGGGVCNGYSGTDLTLYSRTYGFGGNGKSIGMVYNVGARAGTSGACIIRW